MKNIKIFATFCICLLLFSACSDDWKENALTAKFSLTSRCIMSEMKFALLMKP